MSRCAWIDSRIRRANRRIVNSSSFGGIDESPLGDLPVSEGDAVQLVASQCASVEHEQHLVALVRPWSPINREEPTDANAQSQFFGNLAGTRIQRALPLLDVTAWDLPIIFVRRTDKHHVAVLVKKESA